MPYSHFHLCLLSWSLYSNIKYIRPPSHWLITDPEAAWLADDCVLFRQHKTACLRVTALLAVKEMLWIGTSAGIAEATGAFRSTRLRGASLWHCKAFLLEMSRSYLGTYNMHYTVCLICFSWTRGCSCTWTGEVWISPLCVKSHFSEEGIPFITVFTLRLPHCNENPIYIVPEKELCGVSPNFRIHCVCKWFIIIYSQDRSTYLPAAE